MAFPRLAHFFLRIKLSCSGLAPQVRHEFLEVRAIAERVQRRLDPERIRIADSNRDGSNQQFHNSIALSAARAASVAETPEPA